MLKTKKVMSWRIFFFSSRRRHTILQGDWSSDVCSSDLSVLLSDLLAAPPIGSPEAKPRPAILWPRGVGATSARQRARWRGNACCDDSGKAPLFPSSQSSGSHVQSTTRYVVRQAYLKVDLKVEQRWDFSRSEGKLEFSRKVLKSSLKARHLSQSKFFSPPSAVTLKFVRTR